MKRTPGLTIEEREAYWTNIITEARKCNSGVTAYCKAKNILATNYYFWFRRLRKAHPEWHDLSNVPSMIARRSLIQKNIQIETEVSEKATRRKFSSSQKTRILRETDSAGRGHVAAILRREGIYASHLQQWRTEREITNLAAAEKRTQTTNPLAAEIKKLKAKNERLEKRLEQANKIIELQKKVSEILGIRLQEIDDED